MSASFNIIEERAFFYPSKLDTSCPQKKVITEPIIENMKEIADLSNANIVRNAQCLLSGRKSVRKSAADAQWSDRYNEGPQIKKNKDNLLI